MIIASGNTYNVKEDLKAVGFSWNKEEKQWEASSFDKETWENKRCSARWNGRKLAGLCQAITFEEVE